MIGLCAGVLLESVRLSQLDLTIMRQDWGSPQIDASVDKHELAIGGRKFGWGVGTHATSVLNVTLDGKVSRFRAWVGVDDESLGKPGSVEFRVLADGKDIWRSGVMRAGNTAKRVDVDLKKRKLVTLMVSDGGDGIDYDHADWAEADFVYDGKMPIAKEPEHETAVILTPKPPATPKLTGPRVFGVKPGNPLLFTITATGDKPMTFGVQGLPPGVALDENTGRLTGKIVARGEYELTVSAKNAKGMASRKLRLVCGDKIALTPPLGWNSWNCFAGAVDEEKVKLAAKAFVDAGLKDHGWAYINIDDCWSIRPGDDPVTGGDPRDSEGRINTNKKFPDMSELTRYIHGLGLKAGIYSSPGPLTCAGFTSSYQFEDKDAKQWADWGFDYIKYDWCSYGGIAPNPTLDDMKKPYQLMRGSLDKVNRDIVYSLCQYGMGDVWKWGASVGGNCWRTTGDITDTWSSMSGIGFSQAGHEKNAGPGHWNDPDMLVVGYVGWGPNLRPTRLTPNEQYTHISLWCLLASPLLIGCDLTRLDDFTKSLLTNDEVLAVNQDPLGKQASRVDVSGESEVWAKELEDGSLAVGLFNRSELPAKVTAIWAKIGRKGAQPVRDLWRQKALGVFKDSFSATVPRHGVVLVKIGE